MKIFSPAGIAMALNLGLSFILASGAVAQTNTLTIERAIGAAIAGDPWLTGNRHNQAALEAQSIAASTQPDPVMSVSLASIPLDSFDFNQEGMTQLKIGIAQKFARGDSLSLASKQIIQQSEQFPLLRLNRQAQLRAQITELWLRVYQADQSIALINRDRRLFEQLVDVAESSYSSTLGKTRQQDVIRAHLELIRLDDRLTRLGQQKAKYLRLMTEWVPVELLDLPLSSSLPDMALPAVEFKPMPLSQMFSQHPGVVAIERKIASVATGIDVAKQGYQPQWGINASYGYRDDTPNNVSRADLLSVGLTFDLPLFTLNKQDQQVKAAISRAEAVKTDKLLLLKQMISKTQALNAQLAQLTKRELLYSSQLVPQTRQQAEASLNAYANDSGDFSEVMRARITELNTTIEVLNIDVEQRILKTRIAYFFTDSRVKD